MVIKIFGNYRVIINAPNDNNIYVITFDHWNRNRLEKSREPFLNVDDECTITKKGLNRIYIQTSENDWYQRDGILESLSYIKTMKNDKIYITLGASMAGYAAIEFSHDLNSDFFFALSPQYSIDNSFMSQKNDYRWSNDRRLLKENKISIRSNNSIGINKNKCGVVFCDPDYKEDRIHAESIMKSTKCRLIKTYGMHHSAGTAVSHYFKTMSLIKEIGEHIRRDQNVSLILDHVQNTLENSDFKMAIKGRSVDKLFEISPSVLKKISLGAWKTIYKKRQNTKDVQYLLCVSHFINIKNGKELRDFISKHYNIYDYNTLEEIEKKRHFFGPDVLRDEAIRLEEIDIEAAYFIIGLAKELRPTGGRINQIFYKYKKLVG